MPPATSGRGPQGRSTSQRNTRSSTRSRPGTRYGNLRLTFLKNDKGGSPVDADVGGASGIGHLFRSFAARSRRVNDPFDIHEFLTFHAAVGVGYTFGGVAMCRAQYAQVCLDGSQVMLDTVNTWRLTKPRVSGG